MSMQWCMQCDAIFVKTLRVMKCANGDNDDSYVLFLIWSFQAFRIKHVLLPFKSPPQYFIWWLC